MKDATTPKIKGESLIELVLAMAIFAAILPTVLFAIGTVNQSEPQRNNYFNSTLITEETKNIVQQIKNENWNNLPANGEYILTNSGSSWTWTAISTYGAMTPFPTARDGITRSVTISDALRTAGGALTDVVSGSVVDAATKKITINTTWTGAAAPASSVVYISRNNAIQTVTFTTTSDFQAGGQVTNGTVLNTPTPGDDGSIGLTNANPSKASSLVSWWSMNAYVTDAVSGVSWIADSNPVGGNSAIVYPLPFNSPTPVQPPLVDSRFGKAIQLNVTGVPVPPVALYKMDETLWNGTANEVANAVVGGPAGVAVSGATTTSASKYGAGAGTFNGTTNGVLVDGATLNPSTPFSLSMWVYPTRATIYDVWAEISSSTTCDNNPQIWIDASGVLTLGRCSNGAGANVGVAATLVSMLNTWSHIEFVYNGTTTTAYLNGTLVGTPYTYAWPSFATSRFAFGFDRTGVTRFFQGRMDDVRIYDYARTLAQVQLDMAGNTPIADETNLSHLRVVYNSSNMNLGASNNPMSWEYMIKPTGTTAKPIIEWWTLGLTPTPTVGAQGWLLGSGADIFTDLKPPSGSQYTSASQITAAKYNHVVMTYDGSLIKHYLNGALVGTSSSVSTPPSTAYPLSIGYRYPNSYFIGEIDDVAIYSAALSAQEVHDSIYSSFTSTVRDFGHGQSPQMLSLYAEVNEPTDTDIQVRVATRNEATDGSDICPTSESEYTFVGPAGTTDASDYFNATNSTISGIIYAGTTGNYVNPARCLRYKVYMKSLNAFPSGSQPTLSSIRFTYAL
ncbi:MAG: LamG domain-containing protein [Candidatus Roizmanbacteria bacterium]